MLSKVSISSYKILVFCELLYGIAFAQIPNRRPTTCNMDFYLSVNGGSERLITGNQILYRDMSKDYNVITLRLKNFPRDNNYSNWLSDSLKHESIEVVGNRLDTILKFNFQPPNGFLDDKRF
ncbi:MAG: hypothetical protein HYV28_04440 [Ignavibacteriales bacterium]|nr:hypothetical protein [Ignavibacteriales bacterium]